MKLLLSLILILSIVFNSASCIKNVKQNQLFGSSSSSSGSNQNCFTSGSIDYDGYTTTFGLVSNNGIAPSVNGGNGVQKQTFSEEGNLNIDFVNKQMFVFYNIQLGNTDSIGKLWVFDSNNTAYVAPFNNGFQTCYSTQLTYDFPTLPKVSYQDDYKIGTYQCEAFKVLNDETSPSNSTYQVLLVGKDDCSLTSSISYNTDGSQGSILTNFYEFVAESNPSDFQLPSICANATPLSSASGKKLLKNHQLPSLVSNLL